MIFYLLGKKRGIHFNAIQDEGGGQKGLPTSVSPVTSSNVEISPQNFLKF